jgi:hypothetical protein
LGRDANRFSRTAEDWRCSFPNSRQLTDFCQVHDKMVGTVIELTRR